MTLSQNADATEDTAKRQTFHTVKGLSDENAVSFESVTSPGMYVTLVKGTLKLTDGSDKKAATFTIGE